ncbi:DUF490 domain-containing protein [Herbaspirillum sp. HC18]|nr:DUF490 domain-containing protein [Herbaspirillum sp. HC18]
MASEEKRRGGLLRRALYAALAVVLLAFALVAWLLGTTSGARAALAAAEALSHGGVRASVIDGRLAGALHLGSVTLEQDGNRLAFKDVRLDWRPFALLERTLHIEMLHVSAMEIANSGEQKKEPPALPQNIAFPLVLRADDVRLGTGAILRGTDRLLSLGPLALQLDFDGRQYRLQLARLSVGSSAFAANINGEATLSAATPYAIQGRFSGNGKTTIQERAVSATGALNLDGSLQRLATTIDLAADEARIKGNAILLPFSPAPLGPSQLAVESLDLANFRPGLPKTLLDLSLSADENGSGELAFNNHAAGPYDDGKLPVSSLHAVFRQDKGGLAVDRIVAQLGALKQPAGDITGQAHYVAGALSLTLRTDALDLKRVDHRIRSTHLSGEAEVRHADGRQSFRIALTEQQQQRLTLDLQGEHSGQSLEIRQAVLQAGGGKAALSGRMTLDGRQDFNAQGDIAHFRLRELGNFPQLPDFDLNGTFSLHGMRQPRLEADLAFKIDDSTLAGQPLLGDGAVQLRGERLLVSRFLLASGANRLNIEGQLSDDGAQLAFALNAQQLAQLGPAFAGSLQANGTVRGSLSKPHVDAEWSANNARLPGQLQIDGMQGKADIMIDRARPLMLEAGTADINARGLRAGDGKLAALSAQLRFAPQPEAPLALTLRAEGMATAQFRAERMTATARGTTGSHTMELGLEETGQSWTAKAAGGLAIAADTSKWQGSINAFNARGRFNAQLASPSRLLLSAERVRLEDFRLESDTGRLAVEQFMRDASGIATRGRIERLQLARLLQQASALPRVKTDLELSGEWDLRIADALSGALSLRRDRGDLTVLAGSPVTLGLSTLSANATANAGRLAVQFQAEGKQFGRMDINAGTSIGDAGNRLAIAPDAPVNGSARIDVPSLAWLGPLLSPSISADGRLQGDIQLGGSFAQPQFAGRIGGDALRLAMTDIGLDLRQGTLDSEFQGERLIIKNLAFQGTEGRVALSGPIDLGGGTIAAHLTLQAERFTLLNRSDLRFVTSGSSTLDWSGEGGKLAGAFTIDSGLIDLGQSDKPALSDDVVIVGKQKKQPATAKIAMDVTISAGDGIELKGRGIDGKLKGQLQLVSKAGETLQAQGTLNVEKGTYTAYGRELEIEQGVVRFRGPLNNPSLDILAMRRKQEVEAGVSIRGTALAPRVTLVSEPSVPDTEKLSWLVLGHGMDTAGETDAKTLQTAASVLLSESAKAGVQSRLASTFGLDTISVGTTTTSTAQGNLQQRVVTVGKQISSRLYLGYEQGLETAGSVVHLRYALSSKLSAEAEAGTRSALSLFYNIAFD